MIQISDPVINHITFGTDDAARAAFQHMLHEVQAEGQPLGSIDFNKLIPMPEALAIRAGFQTDQGLKLYSSFIEESAAIVKATLFMPETECSAIVTKHLAKWDAVKKKDPETWALGEKAFQNIKKYGCPTWVNGPDRIGGPGIMPVSVSLWIKIRTAWCSRRCALPSPR